MSSERLYDALTDIREEFITEAREHKLKKSRAVVVRWRTVAKWCAIAASLALVIGIGGRLLSSMHFGAGGGAAGHADGSTVFEAYAGPVFPLTTIGSAEGITASRDITFDFDGFGEPRTAENGGFISPADISVADSYTLTNETANDITAEILYPFAGTFSELYKQQPVITAGDTVLETELLAGLYSSDGFYGWEDYSDLLSDGEYLKQALDDMPELNQNVTVYEFSSLEADRTAAAEPTLAVSFDLDSGNTTVLSYGFNGGRFDYENNRMQQRFPIPREDDMEYERKHMLIFVGEDVQNLTVQGYKSGHIRDGEEMDVTAEVTRYETKLSDVLRELLEEYVRTSSDGRHIEEQLRFAVDIDMLYRASAELILTRNSDFGDIFSSALSQSRVFYLRAEVEIPAGESVTLNAQMIKSGSYDHDCERFSDKNLYGYDMLTQLGSNLTFSNLTASLAGAEQIKIVRQNFGFDPTKGILNVTLDPDIPRYYLEVRARAIN